LSDLRGKEKKAKEKKEGEKKGSVELEQK